MADVSAAVNKYKGELGQLIPILQDIQAKFYYLPKEALIQVSEATDIPLSRIYSVATFFKAFSLEPRGRHMVSVCLGTACHVRGAPKVLEQIERNLKISRGETTSDFKFTLETVNCMGCCALGPVVRIDGKYFGEINAGKVDSILNKYE
ncbi:MAG: NAD(P)H-dependent oxidoreductase subunit E [Dehalococcoidia bacterium]|nr:NAD(P)H-dependent oxidoreductase subunit E [Dehalococcoidia bacterium]